MDDSIKVLTFLVSIQEEILKTKKNFIPTDNYIAVNCYAIMVLLVACCTIILVFVRDTSTLQENFWTPTIKLHGLA